MPRLKQRNRSIPNGMRFYVPQTKWRPPQYASFDTIVNTLMSHLRANKHVLDQNGWKLDYGFLADVVDTYNANICLSMGWNDYIVMENNPGVALVPKQKPLPQKTERPKSVVAGAKKIVEGAKIIIEWINSGADAVAQELAEERAAICVACPLNGQGDWTAYFTTPVSMAIRSELEKRKNMNLSTSHDSKLKVCTGCMCPLPLKVHIGIEKIVSKLDEPTRSKLDSNCWILKEGAK